MNDEMYAISISKVHQNDETLYVLKFGSEDGINAFLHNLEHLTKTLDLADGCSGVSVHKWLDVFYERAGRTKTGDIVTYLTDDEFPVFAITLMGESENLDCAYIKLLGESRGHDMIVQAQHKIIEDLHDKVLHYKEILGEDSDDLDDLFGNINKGPKYYS